MVRFPPVTDDSRVPFDTATRPSGVVTERVYVALSVGVSLHGNQLGAPCGSFATNAPSGVGMKPSSEPSGSITGFAVPA